jgi:hypothetical protein
MLKLAKNFFDTLAKNFAPVFVQDVAVIDYDPLEIERQNLSVRIEQGGFILRKNPLQRARWSESSTNFVPSHNDFLEAMIDIRHIKRQIGQDQCLAGSMQKDSFLDRGSFGWQVD